MRRLGVSATARASFYVYSDDTDVDALVGALTAAQRIFASTSEYGCVVCGVSDRHG